MNKKTVATFSGYTVNTIGQFLELVQDLRYEKLREIKFDPRDYAVTKEYIKSLYPRGTDINQVPLNEFLVGEILQDLNIHYSITETEYLHNYDISDPDKLTPDSERNLDKNTITIELTKYDAHLVVAELLAGAGAIADVISHSIDAAKPGSPNSDSNMKEATKLAKELASLTTVLNNIYSQL